MKTGHVILIAAIFLAIGIVIANLYIKSNKQCYELPTEGGTNVWGPYYWRAIHGIADRIPCSLCREEGSELFSFVHDYVNFKTDKPIFNEANYDKWLAKFSEINAKRKLASH